MPCAALGIVFLIPSSSIGTADLCSPCGKLEEVSIVKFDLPTF